MLADHVPDEPCARRCGCPPTSTRHRDWLAEYAALGFDDLYLHHVGQDQADFIDAFGEHVLPDAARETR